jgi:hypothetical protein
MTNKEAVELFDEAHGIKINKMFWIAGCWESSDLKEMVEEDMSDRNWARTFPDIPVESFREYLNMREGPQIFVDYRKFGFLVELHFPHHYDFTFAKDGTVRRCAVSGGIHTIDYAYGETIEELMTKIKEVAEINYQDDIKNDKKKQKKKTKKNHG